MTLTRKKKPRGSQDFSSSHVSLELGILQSNAPQRRKTSKTVCSFEREMAIITVYPYDKRGKFHYEITESNQVTHK